MTAPKPILPTRDIDRDLFGHPVTRPLDDDQLMDEAIDGLREFVLNAWPHASDETLDHYFHDELGGAEGAILEFGYHFDVLEQEGMQVLAAARFEIVMKDEIKLWASQHRPRASAD